MICHVAPTYSKFKESIATLKYAELAKLIKVSPEDDVEDYRAVQENEYKLMVDQLKSELESIKRSVNASHDASSELKPGDITTGDIRIKETHDPDETKKKEQERNALEAKRIEGKKLVEMLKQLYAQQIRLRKNLCEIEAQNKLNNILLMKEKNKIMDKMPIDEFLGIVEEMRQTMYLNPEARDELDRELIKNKKSINRILSEIKDNLGEEEANKEFDQFLESNKAQIDKIEAESSLKVYTELNNLLMDKMVGMRQGNHAGSPKNKERPGSKMKPKQYPDDEVDREYFSRLKQPGRSGGTSPNQGSLEKIPKSKSPPRNSPKKKVIVEFVGRFPEEDGKSKNTPKRIDKLNRNLITNKVPSEYNSNPDFRDGNSKIWQGSGGVDRVIKTGEYDQSRDRRGKENKSGKQLLNSIRLSDRERPGVEDSEDNRPESSDDTDFLNIAPPLRFAKRGRSDAQKVDERAILAELERGMKEEGDRILNDPVLEGIEDSAVDLVQLENPDRETTIKFSVEGEPPVRFNLNVSWGEEYKVPSNDMFGYPDTSCLLEGEFVFGELDFLALLDSKETRQFEGMIRNRQDTDLRNTATWSSNFYPSGAAKQKPVPVPTEPEPPKNIEAELPEVHSRNESEPAAEEESEYEEEPEDFGDKYWVEVKDPKERKRKKKPINTEATLNEPEREKAKKAVEGEKTLPNLKDFEGDKTKTDRKDSKGEARGSQAASNKVSRKGTEKSSEGGERGLPSVEKKRSGSSTLKNTPQESVRGEDDERRILKKKVTNDFKHKFDKQFK